MRVPAFFALACSLLLSLGSAATYRGLDPALAKFYEASQETFTCLDRSRKLPFSLVNDNYCDCLDGSDEPGTSACAAGSFYCQNRGYEPLKLNSSMVDDGICDCCDGSDEPNGHCKSTCLEAGAELRKDLKAQATAFSTGSAKREVYIRDAGQKKAHWASQLQAAKAAAKQQQRAVDRLKAAKDKVEAQEKSEREAAERLQKQQEEAEAKKKEQETAAQIEASRQESDSNPSPDSTSTGPDEAASERQEMKLPEVPKYEVPAMTGTYVKDASTPKSGAGTPAGEAKEAGTEAGAEADSDREARERLAQWVRDDSAQPAEPAEGAAEDSTEGPEEPEPEEGGADDMAGEGMAAEPSPQPSGIWGRIKGWLSGKLARGSSQPGTGQSDRQAVKDNYFTENRKLVDLNKEVTDLETRLQQDFGTEGQFAALVDRCFEVKADKYTYSMCPFGEATQKEGGGSTRLGTWQGFGDNYTTMLFDKGVGCWQGPARSFQVTLKCGATESLSRVQEPNRCEYTAVFATPAACTPALAAAVRDRLQSWDVHDEL